jgi:hypothetical protein
MRANRETPYSSSTTPHSKTPYEQQILHNAHKIKNEPRCPHIMNPDAIVTKTAKQNRVTCNTDRESFNQIHPKGIPERQTISIPKHTERFSYHKVTQRRTIQSSHHVAFEKRIYSSNKCFAGGHHFCCKSYNTQTCKSLGLKI